MTDWYKLESDQVLGQLESEAKEGLQPDEAARRLETYGTNELIERGVKSPWAILWEQLTALMVLILIGAAIASGFLGDFKDAVVIMIIVVMNAVLGFTQEYRAEQAIAALKKMAVPTVKVRRKGEVQEISARDLVPGDVMMLEAGSKVSADGRLLESVNLRVEEAALTGESEPVEKNPGVIERDDLPLGDRRNMVYMGTIVTYGRGMAVVTETGMSTQLGSIAEMIQSVEREPTPLQRRLDGLGRTLALVTLLIIILVVFLGFLRDEEFTNLLLTGIAMAVAAIPEGLPAVVTITLALGSRRMLRRQSLIRKLPAVETLGSVTVICSDKTGTLTENRMTVTMLDVAGESRSLEMIQNADVAILDAEFDAEAHPPLRTQSLLMKASTLCNDSVLQRQDDGSLKAIGDPTEGALIIAAAQIGLYKPELEERWPRVAEVPFTSERKRMTTIHKPAVYREETTAPWRDAEYVAFSKGAVDSLLEVVSQVWVGDEFVTLDDSWRSRIDKANQELAQQGQRVLGVAFRPFDEMPDSAKEEELEKDLIFIGLVAMLDPPRPEVKNAVAVSRRAGIRPVMITGDHPLTALHIAQELDITRNDETITGRDLASMDMAELERRVGEVSVFARVSPEHKLNIVQALQNKGEVVAMTGDGVNDAPALKKSDIGIAMGITGTDVSKEAADMVLLDDNFATIVAAVEEGRVIYDNIRKFIKYILSSNTGEILVMLIAPFFGMPLPLLPLQILWINLVTDGLPGLALAIEPAERDTMRRSPFHPGESVFSRGIGRQILLIGVLMGLVSFGVGYWGWRMDSEGNWQTMVFTTLTLAQMGNALAIRSNRESLFTIGLLSNKAMLGAVLLTFVLQLAVIYLPFLQNVFDTNPLSLPELVIALLLSTVVFWAAELEKWWRHRREQG